MRLSRTRAFFVSSLAALVALGLAACDGGGGGEPELDNEPPPTPTGLEAFPEPGAVELSWDPVEAEDLAGYRIYRRIEGRPPEQIAAVQEGNAAYLDQRVQGGIRYFYQITAVDTLVNESSPSEEVAVTPEFAPNASASFGGQG